MRGAAPSRSPAEGSAEQRSRGRNGHEQSRLFVVQHNRSLSGFAERG